jgi:hypothetical protein
MGVIVFVCKLEYFEFPLRLKWIQTFIQGCIKMNHPAVRINVLIVTDKCPASDKSEKGEILKSLEE